MNSPFPPEFVMNPRALLAGLLEHAPLAVQVYGRDGQCVFVNAAFRALFGSAPPPQYNVLEDELLKAQGFTPLLSRAFAGEVVTVPPHWYDPRELKSLDVREGRRVAIAVTLFPVGDDAGGVGHIALCFKDVTSELERTSSSQPAPIEARLTEAQLRDLTDALPHLVWTCLADGPCDYLSRQWVEYTGIPEADQLGYGWLQQLHPDDRDRVKVEWAGTVGKGAPFDIEFRIRRADGAHRWFRARAIPLRAASGEIVKWYGSNTDIEEYKSAVESLTRSEERWRLAQQVAAVGSFEWNIQTGANLWTAELEAMYGLRAGGFGATQPSWEQLIHAEDRAAATASVESALAGTLPVEGEWRVVWPDGGVHWLVGRFQVFRDSGGQPHRLIGVNVDITKRKAAEDEIRRLNQTLEHRVQERTAELSAVNRELEAFSYSVAHDLRAPLRGMSGFAALVLDDYSSGLDPTAISYLRKIESNAQHMARLIDALLSLARLTRAELKREPTDLGALARAIAARLAADEPRASIELVIEDDLRASVDTALATNLLENLIGNAWKFTRNAASPRLEVGTATGTATRIFFVRDNGAGFDMAHSDRLFNPFQRLHSPREYPGTGIGLATARRIVERHGGHIWAEAAVGRGATFYFTLEAKP